MKKQGAPSHGISSKCSPFSSLLISLLGEHYLDSSWEVAYLQLEVELVIGLYHEAASLVSFYSSASSSSMGII